MLVRWMNPLMRSAGADPDGSAGGARPPLFVPNSLKSPMNRPKCAENLAPKPSVPPPFSNPGSAPDQK